MDPLTLARQLVAHPRFTCENGVAVRVLRDGRWIRGVVFDASAVDGVWIALATGGVWINLATNRDGIRLDSLSDPATIGVLQVNLLRADPTAVLRYDARETDAPFAVTVTDAAGTRRGFGGNDLGVIVAQGLLAVWGS
jgi:hypothetical protein